MALLTKDYETIINEMIIYLQTSLAGIITDFNPGSVIRTFAESVAYQIGTNSNITVNLYGQLENVYNAAFISTSTDGDLDKLVELVGVTRIPAVSATGVVRFYSVPAPVTDITISSGTQVSTQPDASGNRIVFLVDADTVLLAGNTQVDANVTAQVAGAGSNVGASVVTYLATPVFGITSITNPSGIGGGVDEESDVNLRIRAKSAVEVSGNATVNSLRLAVLGVAGVGSVTVNDLPQRTQDDEVHVYLTGTDLYDLYHYTVIDDGYMNISGTAGSAPYVFVKNTDYQVDVLTNQIEFGIGGTDPDNGTNFLVDYNYNSLGEVDMIVAGTTIPMPGPVVTAVEAVIDYRKAAGIKVTLIEPSIVLQNVTCVVTVLSGYTPSAVKTDVQTNLTNYLNTMEVGADVYRSNLFAVIQSTTGVENSTISVPASDVSISSTEVARAGSIVVT